MSACPEWYPTVDVLHLGELGDATDRLVERLDRDTRRPARQEVYETAERLPLEDFRSLPTTSSTSAGTSTPACSSPRAARTDASSATPRPGLARYGRQARETWQRRKPLPTHSPRRSRADLVRGARITAHVTWEVGVGSGYRMAFWRLVAEAVRAGQPEVPIQAGIVAHHLIRYTRDAVAGRAARAFYAPPATGPSSAAARGIDAVRS